MAERGLKLREEEGAKKARTAQGLAREALRQQTGLCIELLRSAPMPESGDSAMQAKQQQIRSRGRLRKLKT